MSWAPLLPADRRMTTFELIAFLSAVALFFGALGLLGDSIDREDARRRNGGR